MSKRLIGQMLLLAFVFGGSTAGAYDFKAGDLYYNIVEGGAEVTTPASGSYELSTVSVPSTVTDGTDTYNVVAIGDSAFEKVKTIKSVTLPEGLKVIGKNAFAETGFAKIELPESLTEIKDRAFYYCDISGAFVIPDNVTTIGSGLFSGCDNLKEVTFGEKLTNIGNNIFGIVYYHIPETTFSTYIYPGVSTIYCKSLVPPNVNGVFQDAPGEDFFFRGIKVYVPQPSCKLYADTKNWKEFNNIIGDPNLPGLAEGHSLFAEGDVNYDLDSQSLTASVVNATNEEALLYKIPASVSKDGETYMVTSIGPLAFYGFKKIRGISLPNTLQSLGDMAFEGCTSLGLVRLSDTEVSVGERTFANCQSLSTVEINKCTGIGAGVFEGCKALSSLKIGTLFKVIPDRAFYGCNVLASVDIHDGITEIGDLAFAYSGIRQVNLPSSLICLGDSVFSNCHKLEKVNLPETITDIPPHMFVESMLTECILSDATEVIGEGAFKDTKLESIVIPASVKSIASNAFLNAGSLRTIRFKGKLDRIGKNAFKGCTSIEAVHIDDLNGWAQTEFYSENSNPIYYAKGFYIGGELARKINLDLGEGSVSMSAFYGCESLETVSVKAKGIGYQAFKACKNIKDLYLDVDKIDADVFTSYPINVYVNRQTPPVSALTTFDEYQYTIGTLNIPEGTIDLYKSATCWNRYLNVAESNFTGLDEIFGESGIDDVEAVIPEGEAEYYDLRGVRVNPEGLAPGLYIKRQGGKSSKVIVN